MENFAFIIFIFYGWVLVVGAARKLVTTIAHHAIHRTFGKNSLVNLSIAELATTVTLSATYDQYDAGHRKKHHVATVFTTETDPDAAFMLELGFEPGKSVDELWKTLRRTIFSPTFHAKYTWERIKLNFWHARPYRLALSITWWSLVFWVIMAGYWLIVVVAYIIPITVLFQMSAVLQFVSEHEWLVSKRDDEAAVLAHSRHSWGRFIGPSLPSEQIRGAHSVIPWFRFLTRVLVIYIPVRVAILPGDLPQHDQHHRKPMGDWPNACYERYAAAIGGTAKVPYQHFWSLRETISHVFRSLSREAQL